MTLFATISPESQAIVIVKAILELGKASVAAVGRAQSLSPLSTGLSNHSNIVTFLCKTPVD
jgi:hypothetical protein